MMTNNEALVSRTKELIADPPTLGLKLYAQDVLTALEHWEALNAETLELLKDEQARYVKDTDILFLARKAAERELAGHLAGHLAATPAPPVAGSKTAAQLLKSRRDAGLTAADIPKDYAITAPVAGEPERMAMRGVVGNVLYNASNYPGKAGVHILGQDMGPLIDRTVDAMIAAGYWREHEPRKVEWGVQVVDSKSVVLHATEAGARAFLAEYEAFASSNVNYPRVLVSRIAASKWEPATPSTEEGES